MSKVSSLYFQLVKGKKKQRIPEDWLYWCLKSCQHQSIDKYNEIRNDILHLKTHFHTSDIHEIQLGFRYRLSCSIMGTGSRPLQIPDSIGAQFLYKMAKSYLVLCICFSRGARRFSWGQQLYVPCSLWKIISLFMHT